MIDEIVYHIAVTLEVVTPHGPRTAEALARDALTDLKPYPHVKHCWTGPAVLPDDYPVALEPLDMG